MARLFCASLVAVSAQDLFLASGGAEVQKDKRPNFVYVLLDDMSKMLGDEHAVPQTRELLAKQGASMENFFVSSPKCTPSRSAWLSGRYYHNLRPNGATSGKGLNTTNHFDSDALFPQLHAAGYQTAIYGKIHNNQAEWLCNDDNYTEPFTHIETECRVCGQYYVNGYGLVVKDDDNTVPYKEKIAKDDPVTRYAEAQYGNRSIAWMRKAAKANRPFFLYIGTTGPHLGVTPAPWHRTATEYLNVSAPRTPNFNMLASDHFPMLAAAPELDANAIEFEDRLMRDRWGTMMSIDDLVAGLVQALEEEGVLDSTYVLFSSDHGYHLGQFRIPDEKMLPYETDIRVTFWIRGPGIAKGSTVHELTANVDIAPTLLELAGVTVPPIVDGKSMVPLLRPEVGAGPVQWRTSFITEFAEGAKQKWGGNHVWALGDDGSDAVVPTRFMPGMNIPAHDLASPCPVVQYDDPLLCRTECDMNSACAGWVFQRKGSAWHCCQKANGFERSQIKAAVNSTSCGVKRPQDFPVSMPKDSSASPPSGPASGVGEYIYDTGANQWRQLRLINATHDISFTEWDQLYVFDKIDFCEYYDIAADPWQQNNLCQELSEAQRAALHSELEALYQCRGDRKTPSTCP